MTLATFEALDALAAAFSGVDDLPELGRNDLSLAGFAASSAPGIGIKFVMDEDAIDQIVREFGDGYTGELDVAGEIALSVEGPAGSTRDTVMRAGIAALKAVLFPGDEPLAIAGKFEDLRVFNIRRQRLRNDAGTQDVDVFQFGFALFVTAPTPFG
jgi:hypothetical protein